MRQNGEIYRQNGRKNRKIGQKRSETRVFGGCLCGKFGRMHKISRTNVCFDLRFHFCQKMENKVGKSLKSIQTVERLVTDCEKRRQNRANKHGGKNAVLPPKQMGVIVAKRRELCSNSPKIALSNWLTSPVPLGIMGTMRKSHYELCIQRGALDGYATRKTKPACAA